MEKTIWLHVKSGHLYAITELGLREADLEPQFGYKRLGEDNKPGGVTFYRPVREFLDGRYTQFQVDGVGGQVKEGQPVLGREIRGELVGLDRDGLEIRVGDWIVPASLKSAEDLTGWGRVDQPRQVLERAGRDAAIVAGDPKVRWHLGAFRKAKAPI